MKNLPRISFWRERISPTVFAGHAVRCWDMPSNGVFQLFTFEEVAVTKANGWRALVDWRAVLEEKLKAREREMIGFYGTRLFKAFACEYSDDELRLDTVEYLIRGAADSGGADDLGSSPTR